MNPKIIVLLDNLQRTVIATLVKEEADAFVVTKPAVLVVQPTQGKQLQVQLFPLMFREFTANRDEFCTWRYSKNAAVASLDVNLETNLLNQYNDMFKVTPNEAAPTIKLFDDRHLTQTK
jgi:23S rRNA-/tRNA-specific pseudouridylate synthase